MLCCLQALSWGLAACSASARHLARQHSSRRLQGRPANNHSCRHKQECRVAKCFATVPQIPLIPPLKSLHCTALCRETFGSTYTHRRWKLQLETQTFLSVASAELNQHKLHSTAVPGTNLNATTRCTLLEADASAHLVLACSLTRSHACRHQQLH